MLGLKLDTFPFETREIKSQSIICQRYGFSLGYHDHFTMEEFLSVFFISLYPMIGIPWDQFNL